MDWSDERYVRLYTRHTADWVSWPWQSRALFPLLLQSADRAGRVEMGRRGAATLAGIVLLPPEIVEAGLAGLLEDGCVIQDGPLLLIRNFLPAQEATRSPAARQRDHRAASRAQALERAEAHVTKRDEASQNVTKSHAESRAVTRSHELSLQLYPPVPSCASSTQESKALSAGADFAGLESGRDSGLDSTPADARRPEQLAAAVDGYRAEALAEVEAVAEALPALVPPTEQLAGAPQATEGPWLPRQCKSVSGLPPGGGPDEIVAPGGSQGPLERSLREPDAAEEAVALWNSLAGVDLPRVTKLTPGRRKAIKAALALVPLSDWPKAIAAVKAWPWRGDDGTWRPDLDWLLATNRNRTPNILRAAEGALSGKAKPDPRRGIQRVEDQGWDQYPIEAGGKP